MNNEIKCAESRERIERENSSLGHHTKSFNNLNDLKISLDIDIKNPDFIFEGRSFYNNKHKYHYSFKK